MYQKIVENARYKMLALICFTNSPNPKDIHFTIIYEESIKSSHLRTRNQIVIFFF